jgi:hypothetical protein
MPYTVAVFFTPLPSLVEILIAKLREIYTMAELHLDPGGQDVVECAYTS